MSEDFIEVKEQLIDMYNFNKHIKIELKPLGAKAILDYIDSKDKEIERLNNIIDELEKDLEDIFYGRGQHFMDSSVVPIKYVLDKLKELK